MKSKVSRILIVTTILSLSFGIISTSKCFSLAARQKELHEEVSTLKTKNSDLELDNYRLGIERGEFEQKTIELEEEIKELKKK